MPNGRGWGSKTLLSQTHWDYEQGCIISGPRGEVGVKACAHVSISSGQCCTTASFPTPVGPATLRPCSFCSAHGCAPGHRAVLPVRLLAALRPIHKPHPGPRIVIWTTRSVSWSSSHQQHARRSGDALIPTRVPTQTLAPRIRARSDGPRAAGRAVECCSTCARSGGAHFARPALETLPSGHPSARCIPCGW